MHVNLRDLTQLLDHLSDRRLHINLKLDFNRVVVVHLVEFVLVELVETLIGHAVERVSSVEVLDVQRALLGLFCLQLGYVFTLFDHRFFNIFIFFLEVLLHDLKPFHQLHIVVAQSIFDLSGKALDDD
jgi:hypothetical protein